MPKKKVDKHSIMCKIIEFAEKSEEITVYNMVKKLREIGVDVEEETVRRTLKELEKFGILKFKETCIGRTKKEKKVYTLTVPPHMAKNMVEILLGLRSFLREITARVFSSVVVLVKDRKYSVMGLEGEQDFKKAVFNSALPLLTEAYKPDFAVFIFRELSEEHRFTTVIVSPFGKSIYKVIETKEKLIIDEVGHEKELNELLGSLKFFN